MGTAVLFPQDCFRPRSRHKHHASAIIYPSECAPRPRRILPAPAQRQEEAGLLPLPGHAGHSSAMNIPRRGSDAHHFRCRKGAEQRNMNHSSRLVPDVPVYKILQRPKQGDPYAKLIAQFVMVDEVKAQPVTVVAKNVPSKGSLHDGLDVADKCKSCVKAEVGTVNTTRDGSSHKSRSSYTIAANEGESICHPKVVSKLWNGVHTSAVEDNKLLSLQVGELEPKNFMMDEVYNGCDDSVEPLPPSVASKLSMTKASSKANEISCKAVILQRSEGPQRKSPGLRRTSTVPQISTHILGGQYKSKVMHVPFDTSKSAFHADGHGFLQKTTSLSCQERWAGPAYTSSPSPSSLPLPKLCLPHTSFSSLEKPLIVKQYSTSVYMQPFLGSSAPSKVGGAWDVASATESLRKMLNLDPC